MNQNPNLDPVFESDRETGSTPPESGADGSNVVGRPADAADKSVGFHEQSETAADERESFSNEEALKEGGSFDGIGVPVADDSQS